MCNPGKSLLLGYGLIPDGLEFFTKRRGQNAADQRKGSRAIEPGNRPQGGPGNCWKRSRLANVRERRRTGSGTGDKSNEAEQRNKLSGY